MKETEGGWLEGRGEDEDTLTGLPETQQDMTSFDKRMTSSTVREELWVFIFVVSITYCN